MTLVSNLLAFLKVFLRESVHKVLWIVQKFNVILTWVYKLRIFQIWSWPTSQIWNRFCRSSSVKWWFLPQMFWCSKGTEQNAVYCAFGTCGNYLRRLNWPNHFFKFINWNPALNLLLLTTTRSMHGLKQFHSLFLFQVLVVILNRA